MRAGKTRLCSLFKPDWPPHFPHGYAIITTANTVLRQIKRIAETLTIMNESATRS